MESNLDAVFELWPN